MSLSETLRTAVDDQVDLDLGAVHQRVAQRRRRRSRIRAAGGAMGAALLLVGIVALAAGAVDERPSVRAVEPEIPVESSTEPAPTTEAPTTVPETTTSTEPAPTTSTEPAPTTSTEPAPTTEAPTTEAPTTTAPAPLQMRLDGTYVVDTGAPAGLTCPDRAMRVGLSGPITTPDGSTWQRDEQGCATIQDGVYRGEGTFVVTDPGGSTLTGTYLSVAQLPTTGVPYSYAITGGTGIYAGATGSCDLTVLITDGSGSLAQRQEGSIACTATLPA